MERKMEKSFLIMMRVFLIFCFVFFAGLFFNSTVQAADIVTREEWIHTLADTFQMKIEDGLVPDDYYKDISASTSMYYKDIMTAVNFGVIDLEAGEEFHPKEAVTREFAAQTLNDCLGYELEKDAKYTMDDYDALKYAQADQVAVNQGWFSLVNGAFQPEKTITLSEKNNMVSFARNVLSGAKIDENHDNTYEFAKNVIVIPDEVSVEFGKDNKVLIYDPTVKISKGDTFAVFSNGIAYTYKAISVASKSSGIEVETEEVSYNDAVTECDAEGSIEADLEDFVPASDDIKMDVEYEGGAARATKQVKDIKLYKNIGGGKIGCNITSIKVNYRIGNGGYLFSVSGKAKASYTISAKKSFTLPLGYINIAGVGKIQVDMIYSADGSVSLSLSSNFETGIEKTEGRGVRKIKNFTSPSWHFSAKAELRAGCKVSFVIAIPAVADGTLYGETGIKASADIEVYQDGKKPKTCMDLPAYLYATAGYSVRVFGKQVAGDTIPIYTSSNSPLRVCYHIEDGKCVTACSRSDSGSRVGKKGYYSALDAVGTYGSECFAAPQEEVKIFEYELDNSGNATITKYHGNVYALVIPDELDGYPVTGIGKDAFRGNTSIGSVVIPDKVVQIGKDAFNSCSKLTDVVLPDNSQYTYIDEGVFANTISLNSIQITDYITEIKASAFYHCGLVSLHLPEDITTIGNEAFYGCAKLTDLVLPKYLEIFGAACFGNCNSLVSAEIPRYLKENNYHPDYHAMADNGVMRGMFYGCDSLKEIKFAKGITTIPPNLFNGCTGIEEITIPDTVTLIRSHAFNACSSLTKVNIANSVTKIEALAFRKCSSLTNIKIPDSVTEIGCCAFLRCENLSDVHMPKKLKVLGTWSFGNCTSLQKINIPSTVTEVPLYYDGMLTGVTESPFVGCAKLKEVILEEGMTQIAGSLFDNWAELEKITIPASVTEIGKFAFRNAVSLKEVSLSHNLTKIGGSAFKNCKILEKIEIPDTVNNMDSNIFEGCSRLTEVKLPRYRVGIPEATFKNCTSLQKIEFPDTLQYIYANAFEGCEKLESIVTPTGFKGIEHHAFLNCKRLVSADLKGNYISNNAFENCRELTDVKLNDSIYNIGKAAFLNCSSIERFRLSTGLKEISANAFDGCTYLDNLVIPYGVTDIGNEAFKNCTRLKNITISGNVKSISANAFSYPEEVTVYGIKGSYAEEYANDKGMTFVVKSIGAESIHFEKSEYTVASGDSIIIPLAIEPENCNDGIAWTSSDETIATVTNNGTVKGIKQGECTITVKAGELEQACKLIVESKINTLSLSGDKEMLVGSTKALVCTGSGGQTVNAERLRWWTQNPNIATVDQKGNVTAVKKGKTNIEVWLLDNTNIQASIEITVTDGSISVTGIELNKKSLKLPAGGQQVLKAVVLPEDATNKNVNWTSSEPAIATVSQSGVVTAVEAGKTTITAETEDGGFTASCNVEVIAAHVSSISLNKTQLSLYVGDTETLTADVLPEEASDITLTWTSDNEEVASVDENGCITAIGKGTAIITAEADDGSGINAQCEVQVNEKQGGDDGKGDNDDNKDDVSPEKPENGNAQPSTVSQITVTGISHKIAAGKKIKLTAVISPSNAANKAVTWTSSNPKVAKVNSSGKVTMNKKSGGKSVTITATAADGSKVTASYKITSMKGVVKKVAVSGKNTVKAGKTLKLKAKVTATKKANKKLKWTSSNKKYATVNSSGKVKALKAGKGKKVKITAMATDGSGKKKTVTIKIK